MALRKIIIPWEAIPGRDQAWYDHQKTRMTEDEIASEIDRKYVKHTSGKVFTSFRRRLHVTETPIPVNLDLPVYRIWDFGAVNATLFGQIDRFNRRRCIHEIILGTLAHGSSTPEQIDAVAADSERLFRGAKFIDICDPAGSYTDHRTKRQESNDDVSQLERHGINPLYQTIMHMPTKGRTQRSIQRIQYDMQRHPGGEEAFTVYCNPEKTEGCPVLVEALEGGYGYKKDASGNFREEINEQHPWEDSVDVLRYWYLEVNTSPEDGDQKPFKVIQPDGRPDPYTGIYI